MDEQMYDDAGSGAHGYAIEQRTGTVRESLHTKANTNTQNSEHTLSPISTRERRPWTATRNGGRHNSNPDKYAENHTQPTKQEASQPEESSDKARKTQTPGASINTNDEKPAKEHTIENINNTMNITSDIFATMLKQARSSINIGIKSEGTTLEMPLPPARLRHPDEDSRARFRKRVKEHKVKVESFNEMHNTDFKVDVKALTDTSVWEQLSRRYLHKEHRTRRGQPTNDKHVRDLIMRQGEYAKTGRDRPFVRDPIKTLKALKWDIKQQTLEQRHAAYMVKWDEVLDELGESSLLEPKTLAPNNASGSTTGVTA